jgi:hypothetical protein
MEEAARRGTIKMFLLTDAGQREMWPVVRRTLEEGDALYFSHGLSIVYGNMTGVIPPRNVDVILVAPKGSGTSVRRNFLEGSGINSSFAVYQDYTGRAHDRVKAMGIAIGLLLESRFVNFTVEPVGGQKWRLVLRVVIGLVLVIATMVGLAPFLPTAQIWLRALRYALVAIVGAFVWPLIFKAAKL